LLSIIIFTPAEEKNQAVNRITAHGQLLSPYIKVQGVSSNILEKRHHFFIERNDFLNLYALDTKLT
jgi:hypothetical protein